MTHQKRLAILVGGGPAPGINSVISAATIRAQLEGVEVVGVRDGFEWIMQGNVDHVKPLTMDEVSRIHFRGGSYIGISRANPTKNPENLENTVISLLRLNVSQLITIGGDDTAFSAMKLEEKAQGRIHGLTTAASLWTAAGIGIAAGLGLWVAALAATALALFALEVLQPLSRWAAVSSSSSQPETSPASGPPDGSWPP